MNHPSNRRPWHGRIAVGVLALFAAVGTLPADAASLLPGPLVTVQWLHDHAAAVQIVDIRDNVNTLMDEPKYATVDGRKTLEQVGGYIPDALSVNFWALREKHDIAGKKIDFLFPTADEFQAVMQASQLEPGKPVVIVPTGDDATSLQEAAFLAYELEVFGQPADQVAILNGGMHAWIAAGYAVDSDGIAPMTSGHWTAKTADARMVVTTAQMQAALKRGVRVFDARPLAQFVGVEHSPVIPVPGRLEGARALPAEALYFQAEDGSWRYMRSDRYRAAFAALRLGSVAPAVIYCNTGQYAAGAWFVLDRILGLKGVREYPGSLNEWEQRGLPVVGL